MVERSNEMLPARVQNLVLAPFQDLPALGVSMRSCCERLRCTVLIKKNKAHQIRSQGEYALVL
jgi:hypothetical protein